MTISLISLIGEDILVNLPRDNANELFRMKLHGVEAGGIWVECYEVAQALLVLTKMSESKMPLFVYPYSQIGCICVGSDELTAISEKSLGV